MLKSDKAERFEQALHVAHTALCAVATGYLEAVAEALATLRARACTEITGCASTAEKMPLASPAGERTTHLPVTPEVTADPRQLAIPGA